MKPGQTEPFIGYVLVGDDGKIKAIGRGNPPAGMVARTTYDAKGKFVLPGFISAHSHLSESAFRGLATDQYVYPVSSVDGVGGSTGKRASSAPGQRTTTGLPCKAHWITWFMASLRFTTLPMLAMMTKHSRSISGTPNSIPACASSIPMSLRGNRRRRFGAQTWRSFWRPPRKIWHVRRCSGWLTRDGSPLVTACSRMLPSCVITTSIRKFISWSRR